MSEGGLIWITGLSGSGKTTISSELVSLLRAQNHHILHLDGDVVRGLFDNDLGYDQKDRLKNAYRISKLCSLLTSQGALVVCSTISLYHAIHEFNRTMNGNYLEVFVESDLNELNKRDSKGIYSSQKNLARREVVGVHIDYERPIAADLVIDNRNHKSTPFEISESIISAIKWLK